MIKKSILFICTGNIFRSLSAEQSFKKFLLDNNLTDWKVGSAGTIASPQTMELKVAETLGSFGINNIEHQQRKLSKEMLTEYDIVVGMAENHIDFLRTEFNYNYGLLFNELALDQKTSIWDIEDEVLDYRTNRPAVEEKIIEKVKEIHDKIPNLFKKASERFYLFNDFVAGKTTHRNGFPFIILNETENSLAFMSTDIPNKEDGHILVIPKKRYVNLFEIPPEVITEMFMTIKKIGQALNPDHGGYNVLLNNGLDAGQYIFHTHFHIIPRRSGDGITIEGWKRTEINQAEFIQLNEKIKEQIGKL